MKYHSEIEKTKNENQIHHLYIYIYIYIYVHPTPPSAQAECNTRSIFNQSLTGLNVKFSFSLASNYTKVIEHSPSYYLPIAGRRIVGFIVFKRVDMRKEK